MSFADAAARDRELEGRSARTGAELRDTADIWRAIGATARRAARARGRAYFPDAERHSSTARVYDRYALRRGDAIDGPALIEENGVDLRRRRGRRAS